MIEKILNAVNEYSMFGAGDSVTVALSGGADSVALLGTLNSLKDILGFKLSAVHFNHRIRGSEADSDETFCKDLCKKLGIELFVGSADVPAIAAAKKQSIELAARECRYGYFDTLNTDVIATAHTASDNLETVIFNITRGTGLAGLCGIPPKRDKFVRPLIYCTREEIERYCEANGLSYVNDSSNDIDDCSRNIIRHKVIPALKEINPSAENTSLNSSRFFAIDNNCLDKAANMALKMAYKDGGLNVKSFLSLDEAIVYRLLKMYYKAVCGDSIDGRHLSELYSLCSKEGKISLQKKRSATLKNGILKIEMPLKKKSFTVSFEESDNIFFSDGKKVNNLLLKNAIDCDKIVGELVVRKRIEGDKIRLNKKQGTKSFKKLYNEFKIPLEERENLPVISDAEGPVWVYKIGVADRCAVTENSSKTFVISTSEN